MAADRYATVAQLRTEGLPGSSTTWVTDAQALILLERASQLVEKLTRNLFYEVSGTYIFDGNNSYLLHMPIPIIEVTSLTINNETSALATNEYRAYIGRLLPQDDRHNPKIELRRSAQPSIYTGFSPKKFLKGYDQTVVGKFGYLESDNTIPAAINECVMAIVMMTWQDLYTRFGIGDSGGGGGPTILGPMKREKTDDHEVEWWQTDTAFQEQNLVVPSYIHGRLKLYQAPMSMRVTNYRFESSGDSV
jgi:hypothetical protein